jgi:hypothetical protein
MTTMQNDQDILKRLRELEAENARLRAASSKEEVKLIVTEGEYKGFPTLTFEGSVRRFTLGLTKLRALKEAWPQVESFLERHQKAVVNDDDLKI